MRTAHRLRARTVWINCNSVFDGYKKSGWAGRWGHNALENYLETKLSSSSSHKRDLPMPRRASRAVARPSPEAA